jgi:uncharacterized phage infection (PIP) family protein YhgE
LTALLEKVKRKPFMKPTNLIPRLCAVTLLVGVVFFSACHTKTDAELARLREESQTLRAELEQAKTASAAQDTEVARLRKDNEDLFRLRNEVRQLRTEKQQFAQQLQAAQSARAGAQEQVQQLQQVQAENQQLRAVAQQSDQTTQRNACINCLRQIDGAKQQWALETKKTVGAIPNPQDIAPYLKDRVIPSCPAGGTYTLNAVGVHPTCSIPGHVLPQ